MHFMFLKWTVEGIYPWFLDSNLGKENNQKLKFRFLSLMLNIAKVWPVCKIPASVNPPKYTRPGCLMPPDYLTPLAATNYCHHHPYCNKVSSVQKEIFRTV